MFAISFSHSQQIWDAWTRLAADQTARFDQMAEQMHKMQTQAVTRACEAIDESARLMKDSVTYGSQLSNEWRKITLEATKKAAEAVTPKA